LVSLVFYIVSQVIQTAAGELSIGAVIVATLCKRILPCNVKSYQS
jgi:hypothetical protein